MYVSQSVRSRPVLSIEPEYDFFQLPAFADLRLGRKPDKMYQDTGDPRSVGSDNIQKYLIADADHLAPVHIQRFQSFPVA